MGNIYLSPSALGVFKDCPLCFWLDRNLKIKRPEGPKSGMPNAVDAILKTLYDQHRALGTLPPEIAPYILGTLFPDQAQMKRWRYWKTGLETEISGAAFQGALDDLIISPEGKYSPLDIKTKGSEPDEGYAERYYQHQMDCYTLLLETNERPVDRTAYLPFYFPLPVGEDGLLKFGTKVIRMKTDPKAADDLVVLAVECLSGVMPAPGIECKFCRYVSAFEDLRVGSQKAA